MPGTTQPTSGFPKNPVSIEIPYEHFVRIEAAAACLGHDLALVAAAAIDKGLELIESAMQEARDEKHEHSRR